MDTPATTTQEIVQTKNYSNYWAIVVLILVNLWPIYGVFFLNWNVGTILVLYWAENIVIGFYNIFKMLLAQGQETQGPILVNNQPVNSSNIFERIFLTGFFSVHYGGFCFGHGMFIFMFIKTGFLGVAKIDWQYLIAPIILLFASHGFSFFSNFIGKNEYKNTSIGQLFTAPYGRIMVTHICIIGSGFIIAFLGSPKPVIILLVLLKIVIDLWFHHMEHQKFAINNSTLVA